MLFNINSDEGDRVVGYVVPDSAGATPSVLVRSDGRDLLRFDASDMLQTLVDAGRHATGRCGFVIDETVLPGLASYADLELIETGNDVLIYRRRPADAVAMRVVRFETHLLPLWRLDEALRNKFQFWYKGIDRFGRETTTQVFNLNNSDSIYIGGRLLFKNYEFYLSKGIKTICMLRDPYFELAERLILLKNIGPRASEILGDRDAMIFGPVIEALDEWDNFDEAFCKRFFRRATAEVCTVMSNPLVRQLTGSTPDEMPNQSALSTALDALASFEIVGLRSSGKRFAADIADLLGIDAQTVPIIEEYTRILDLGERLRQNHDIEAILERDLEVFHFLGTAYESAYA